MIGSPLPLFCRALLAAAVLCFAYVAVVLASCIWPLLLFIAALAVWCGRPWKGGGWAHGSARLASEEEDYGGLVGGDGMILAQAVHGRPSLREAAAGLFTEPLARSEAACRRLFVALLPLWPRNVLLRVPRTANHGIVIGPSGSFKGAAFLVSNLRTHDGVAVVLDPKGENFHLVSGYRQMMGHVVERIDFFSVCGPGGACWNPIGFIDPSSFSVIDESRSLACAIVERGQHEGEGKHFNDVAEIVLTALIAFVICHGKREDRHLGTVNQLLKNPEALIGAVASMRESTACGGALAQLGGVISYLKDREFSSVLSTCCRAMAFMDSPAVAAGFRRTSFDPTGLLGVGARTDVFIIQPVSMLKSHAAVTRLLLTSLIRYVVTRNGVQERSKVTFLLDEIANAGPIPELETALTLYRGFGVRLWLILQHLGQLALCFPSDKGQGVLANTDVQVFMGPKDVPTAEYCSSRIGTATVTVESAQAGYGDSHTAQTIGPPESFGRNSNVGRSWSEHGRRVLLPEEILSPYMDGHCLIFAKGSLPVRAKLLPYFAPEFSRAAAPPRRFGLMELLTSLMLLLAGLWLASLVTPSRSASRQPVAAPTWPLP